MPQPRKNLISLDDTPFYHCMSRCVRRAFLCGIDSYSGINYEHRRDWLESKLLFVADVFAIKLCAYAIMSNHYHVVLNVRSDISSSWSDEEVIERWHRLFSGTPLSQALMAGAVLNKTQTCLLSKDIAVWKHRLTDISWFMRFINESIARQANAEDKCTGRFWEGRFKSQALLDDQALLACMAYVDLNPVRAGIAQSPENSDHTSVQSRINTRKTDSALPTQLEQFVGSRSQSIGLPFKLDDYLELVDWTGRIHREDKPNTIDHDLPPILERLHFEKESWKTVTSDFEGRFKQWVGQEAIVKQIYQDNSYQRIPSTAENRRLFG